MTSSIALRSWRALFVAGGLVALMLGPAGFARADTACTPTDLSCVGGTVAPSVPPARDTVDQVKDQASDATKTVEDTVGTAQDAVDDVVDDLLGSDPGPGPGGDPGGGAQGGGPRAGGGHTSGDHGNPTAKPRLPGTAPGSSPIATGTSPGAGGPLVDRPIDTSSGGRPTLAQTVAGIALGVIAPLVVLLLCAFGFVMFQQRLDGQDPHLADAPAVPDAAVFA